nr:MFS transporter [Lysinibacter cavernae]
MTQPTVSVANPKKAAIAAWIGSALEYYDFFIYGTAAALVFSRVFFPDSDPLVGTLLALATFGVGYLARPLGAFVLGHMGDTIGRKRVLVLTVMLMGIATVVVGFLPTYEQVGILAPILLVLMRLIQGFSAGGEQAGANSSSLEHAPANRRAFVTSFTLSGTQAGQILATAVFIPVALLPEDQLLSWGWRVPFWLSGVVVVVALVIRRTLDETPVFTGEIASNVITEGPLKVLFRDHLGAVIRVICCAVVASVSTIFTVYALSYAVNTVGLDRTTILWVGVLSNVIALAAIPLFASLSDRIGRKPVFLFGTIGSAVLMFGYLWAISVGNYPLIFVFGLVLFGCVYSAINGVWPAFYGEMFPTSVRLSGTAIGTQIGFAIAGFSPTIAGAIAGDGNNAWFLVALFTAGLCLINVIAVATARETHKVPMSQLGKAPVEPAPARATASR